MHSTSVTCSGIRRISDTGIKSAFPIRKHIPRFPYELSQSDKHKLPIQKSNMKLSFTKLARRLSKTNRWNLQGSHGEVWRTLPERGGMKRGNVLLFRPRGYLSTRYFTLQILAPSQNTAVKRSESSCIHIKQMSSCYSAQCSLVQDFGLHNMTVKKHVLPTYRVVCRLQTTFKISQHLTKILIHVHKHKKLSRGTTHDQAGRPKLRWSDCTENDLKSTGVKGWRKKLQDRLYGLSF